MFAGHFSIPMNSCFNTRCGWLLGARLPAAGTARCPLTLHRSCFAYSETDKARPMMTHSHNRRLLSALMCWLLSQAGAMAEEASVSFRREIAPILRDSCLACHGPKKAEGGYRVDTYNELLKAGDSGETPIASSAELSSELLRRLACDDDSERMPAESEALPAEQIELFQKWIQAGGKFDGQDASQSLELVIPPAQYADPPAVYPQAVPVTAIVFSGDGKLLVTGGYHELLVWSVADAKLVRRITNIGQRVFSLAFSSDGRTLAVGCGEPGRSGEVRLVDFETGDIRAVVARSHDVVLDLAYRPGSTELAVASADSLIRIIETQSLQEVRTIASHADWVTAIAWSGDGTRLASASRDKSAKVVDVTTGELLASYLGHEAAVRGVAFLTDNKQVVSVGADNKLHRWDIEGPKNIAKVGIGSEGYKLIQSEEGIFVPSADKRLLRFALDKNAVTQEFKGHNDWVLTACLLPTSGDPQSGLIASSSFDGEIRIWNLSDASVVRHWIAKP